MSVTHGRQYAYKMGCRCDDCREWRRQDKQKYAESNRRSARRYYARNRKARSDYRKVYYAQNSAYFAAKRKASHEFNATHATHGGQRWTAEEDRVLLDAGLTRAEKAKALGRSGQAVDRRIDLLRKKGLL